MKRIGIVRETKNEWERRVPITPDDVQSILSDLPVEIIIQPSELRIFEDFLYQRIGAIVDDNLQDCDLIFGIKEIKLKDLIPGKVHSYFSHTIKGQSYNMGMLQKLLDLKCTLIDYERMMNDNGQRLIYFSIQAGQAGLVESLWAFGQQLALKGIKNPFEKIQQTYKYSGLDEIEAMFGEIANDIKESGLPDTIQPMVIGITGYGNVAKGVQQLLDILPVEEVEPQNLQKVVTNKSGSNIIYKVIFKESDMVAPIDPDSDFDLQEYYNQPEKYKSIFEQYLPYMTILMNASFWDTKYPRHVPNESLKRLYKADVSPKLHLIGDISCDINGGVQCTVKSTDPGEPVFTFHPGSSEISDGFSKEGIVIMSVDNLPSELPKDASTYFSSVLKTLLPDMVAADYTLDFKDLNLPDSIKNAVIVYNGQLTPEYEYLKKHL